MRNELNTGVDTWSKLVGALDMFSAVEREGAKRIAAQSSTDEELSVLARNIAQAAYFQMSDDFQEFFAKRHQRIGVKVEGKSCKHYMFLDSWKLGGSTLIALSGQQLRQRLVECNCTEHEAVVEALSEHYPMPLVKVWKHAKELQVALPEHEMTELEFCQHVRQALHNATELMAKV